MESLAKKIFAQWIRGHEGKDWQTRGEARVKSKGLEDSKKEEWKKTASNWFVHPFVCSPLWCLPLASCFPASIVLQHCSLSAVPGAGFFWTTISPWEGKERGVDVLHCITIALLPNMNLGASSSYSSYHGLFPGIGLQAQDGISKRAGKEEFGQIETAKKLPCWTVWYRRLTLPQNPIRSVV